MVSRSQSTPVIHQIRLGLTNSYIIQDEKTILIDGGNAYTFPLFKRKLRKLSLDPKDISLIILTHGHPDHIGALEKIKAYTDAQVAVHKTEKEWVEKGFKGVPKPISAWGAVMSAADWILFRITFFKGAKVDIAFDDGEYDLRPHGIRGKVICTPGHSFGSVSVLLDSGDAFVGDLVMAGFPLKLKPGMPLWAVDIPAVRRGWEMLLGRGVKRMYPGHGNPFPADLLR